MSFNICRARPAPCVAIQGPSEIKSKTIILCLFPLLIFWLNFVSCPSNLARLYVDCGQWLVVGRRSPAAATAAVGSDRVVQLGRERIQRRISIGTLLVRTVWQQSIGGQRLPPPPSSPVLVQEFLLVVVVIDNSRISDQYGSQVRQPPSCPSILAYSKPLENTTLITHVPIHTWCRLPAHSQPSILTLLTQKRRCFVWITEGGIGGKKNKTKHSRPLQLVPVSRPAHSLSGSGGEQLCVFVALWDAWIFLERLFWRFVIWFVF